MRGVHYTVEIKKGLDKGSSPHARGPSQPLENTWAGSRIIPACAGSILLVIFDVVGSWDHPRMRGVH